MKIIGLTGGIGSGKTTVAKMFEALGVPVYLADDASRRLVNTSEEIKTKIVALLGSEAYEGSVLDRPWVAKQVFEDAEKLQQLNHIIHPAVADDFKSWVSQQQATYCLKEAAILFESGSYKNCDAVIVVTAPKDVRVARVMARDGTEEADVRARMKHQLTDAERVARADYVIENIDLKETEAQVNALHKSLQKER